MGLAEVKALYVGYDTKTPAEQEAVRKAAARERARSCHQGVGQQLPITINRSGGRKATVLTAEWQDTALVLTVEFTKGQQVGAFSNPWVIVNPPLQVPDASGPIVIGDQTYREDAVHAIRLALIAMLDKVFPP